MSELFRNSDSRLIAACASGDREAFDELVDVHGGAVLRFLRRRGSDPALVEDAWQEAFLLAWSKAATYRGSGSLRSWLLTIARRIQGRMARRHPPGTGPQTESLDELGLRAGWGRVEAPRVLEQLRIRSAYRRLSAEDREVLWLRDAEGFSTQETAAILGLGLAAVKSRLHRARLRLMAELEGGCDEE